MVSDFIFKYVHFQYLQTFCLDILKNIINVQWMTSKSVMKNSTFLLLLLWVFCAAILHSLVYGARILKFNPTVIQRQYNIEKNEGFSYQEKGHFERQGT